MHKLRYRPSGPSAPPFITTDLYISLEMKRFIETTETPGKYGYFDEVAE